MDFHFLNPWRGTAFFSGDLYLCIQAGLIWYAFAQEKIRGGQWSDVPVDRPDLFATVVQVAGYDLELYIQ